MSRTRHQRRRPSPRDPARHHIKDEHGSQHRYQNHGTWFDKHVRLKDRGAKPAERRTDTEE